MPAIPQQDRFTHQPLTPFARAQLWHALRVRAAMIALNGALVIVIGLASMLPAWFAFRRVDGVPFQIALAVVAAAGVALMIAQARGFLQTVGPYVLALWRGHGLQAVLPPTALRESSAGYTAEVCFAAAGEEGSDCLLQLELPGRFAEPFRVHMQQLTMLPRVTPMHFHVAPWKGARNILYALHQPDEPAPTVHTGPLAAWPAPQTGWSGSMLFAAVALLLLAEGLVAWWAVVAHAGPVAAVLALVVVGGAAFWGGGRAFRQAHRLWMHRGAAPQWETLEGDAQAVLQFRWSLPTKGAASTVFNERWLLLGNQWHRLASLPSADYAPASLPPLPEAMAGIRLEYAVWGRERRLMRAFAAGDTWIGGEQMPCPAS